MHPPPRFCLYYIVSSIIRGIPSLVQQRSHPYDFELVFYHSQSLTSLIWTPFLNTRRLVLTYVDHISLSYSYVY